MEDATDVTLAASEKEGAEEMQSGTETGGSAIGRDWQ